MEIQKLDCINLKGLQLGFDDGRDKLTDKLLAYQHSSPDPNHGTNRIELKVNPLDDSRLLILEGHHRSFASYVSDETVSGVIYDGPEEIVNPYTKLNFERPLRYHQTAELIGLGTITDLIDEVRFQNYLERLQRLKGGDENIAQVIATLESFWVRIS